MRFTTHHRGKAHGACKYAVTGKVQCYYITGEALKNAPLQSNRDGKRNETITLLKHYRNNFPET